MENIQPVNYLRAHRRRSGLTQEELSYLLGEKTHAKIARYERDLRRPSLENLIACELILGENLAGMFPGIAKQLISKLRQRACTLRKRLLTGKNRNAQTERKIETLSSLCNEPYEPHAYYTPHYFDPDCHTNQVRVQLVKSGPPVWAGKQRLLAIDPTSRGFGMAVLEIDETRLLDWKVVQCRDYLRAACFVKIEEEIAYFQPTAILVEDSCPIPRSRCHKLRRFIRKVRAVAKSHQIPLEIVSSARVRTVFTAEGARNQEDRAKVVAKCFPDVAPHLPPHRETWMTENYWMSVFDALALIYAYLKVEGNQTTFQHAQNYS